MHNKMLKIILNLLHRVDVNLVLFFFFSPVFSTTNYKQRNLRLLSYKNYKMLSNNILFTLFIHYQNTTNCYTITILSLCSSKLLSPWTRWTFSTFSRWSSSFRFSSSTATVTTTTTTTSHYFGLTCSLF